MSDPAKYRTKEEVETYKKRDPLLRAKGDLSDSGVNDKILEEIESRVNAKVEESVRYAEESEEPPLGWRYKHVYAEDN